MNNSILSIAAKESVEGWENYQYNPQNQNKYKITPELLERIREEAQDEDENPYYGKFIQILYSTTHTCKGCEWVNVRILEDFIG